MHTFFYSSISEFVGNFEEVLDEGKNRTTVQTMHKLCWKPKYFKSAGVSMLGHSCGVPQYSQFYYTNKKVSNVTMSICGRLFR